MAREVTLDEFRVRSERAGLTLTDQELQQLLAGVNRSHIQAATLRGLLADEIEPANHFSLAAKR